MTSQSQTAAAPRNSASREIEISDWKPRNNKTLRGFLTVTLPSGMVIHDLMLHEKGDARWIGMPTREYKDSQGMRKFAPIVEFPDKEIGNRFRDAVLAALDRHFAETRP